MCESISPGMTVRPCRSITRVADPARRRTSAVVPTATIRPPRAAMAGSPPARSFAPGETVSLRVVVRRPGWSAWALGSERHEHLTVQTPVAHILDRWPAGAHPRIRFDTPVSTVAVGGKHVAATSATVELPTTKSAGAVNVAAAARTWEKLGPPVRATWFPKTNGPVVVASPAPGAELDPLTPLRLTFSQSVSSVLGTDHPRLSLRQPGRWAQTDSHTLLFRPSGDGAPFNADETVRFPTPVRVLGGRRGTSRPFLRLQQLLAQDGYLPSTGRPPAPTSRSRTVRSSRRRPTRPPARSTGATRTRRPSSPSCGTRASRTRSRGAR